MKYTHYRLFALLLLFITLGDPIFALYSPTPWCYRLPVTPRGKINLEGILARLNTTCTECGYSIPPNEIMRIDFDTMRCPKCRAVFTPKKRA